MNKELKDKWISALESGKYEQGRGMLRTRDNKYCPQGVLLDIIDPEMWGKSGTGISWFWRDNLTRGYLPPDVCEDAQIYSEQIDDIISHNDSFGSARKTFPEIAAWIRENV